MMSTSPATARRSLAMATEIPNAETRKLTPPIYTWAAWGLQNARTLGKQRDARAARLGSARPRGNGVRLLLRDRTVVVAACTERQFDADVGEQHGELFAGAEHACLHRADRNSDDVRNLLH